MGEFELIDTFVRALPHQPAPAGPGDDCAVLPKPRHRLCLTTDAVVEGVHFRRPAFSLRDVGHKALAVNLSDLAAMGARPTWWLCALGLPQGFTAAEVLQLAKGMRPLAVASGLTLAGGNVTKSPVLSLTLTLAGEARKPHLRSGARPKDLLYVAGWLGAAANSSSKAQRRATPLLEEGAYAARFAHAAIDVSDGLLQDLSHVLKASGVGAELHSRRLPKKGTLAQALSGGEDYALVLAVPPSLAKAFERGWKSAQPLKQVGVFTKRKTLRLDGRPVAPQGFRHF